MRYCDIVFCLLCFFCSEHEAKKSDSRRVFWLAIVASQVI